MPWPKVGANASTQSTQSTRLHRPHREEDGIDWMTGPQAIVRRSGGPWRGGTVGMPHGEDCQPGNMAPWAAVVPVLSSVRSEGRILVRHGTSSRSSSKQILGARHVRAMSRAARHRVPSAEMAEPPAGSAVAVGRGQRVRCVIHSPARPMAVLRKGVIVKNAIIHHGERRAQTKRLCHSRVLPGFDARLDRHRGTGTGPSEVASQRTGTPPFC